MSGMGWGGVIASAIGGGVAGAMGSVAYDINEQQKAALQAQRDKRLAELAQQTHKANAQASADIEVAQIPLRSKATLDAETAALPQKIANANAAESGTRKEKVETATQLEAAKEGQKYHALPAGTRLVKGDKVIIEGEARVLSEEEAEYWNARTENERAKAGLWVAKAGAVGEGGGSGGEKPRNEKAIEWKKTDDQPGNKVVRYFDKNTGYYMEVTPEVKAKPGDKGVVSRATLGMVKSFEDPDTPGVPEKRVYKDAEGKEVPYEVVEAKRREVSGLKPLPAAGTVDVADAKKQADAAIARSPQNAAAIKARFKQLTGKDYR